jgi:hypothetical protein
MAARRRREERRDRPPQFQSHSEATAWAIIVAGIAPDHENLADAAEEADDLLGMYRDRHEALDAGEGDPEPDDE